MASTRCGASNWTAGEQRLETVPVTRFEQYEIWSLTGDKWEFAAAFHDFDTASHVARARGGGGVRLLHVTYENGRPVEQQVLFEMGATRQHP